MTAFLYYPYASGVRPKAATGHVATWDREANGQVRTGIQQSTGDRRRYCARTSNKGPRALVPVEAARYVCAAVLDLLSISSTHLYP